MPVPANCKEKKLLNIKPNKNNNMVRTSAAIYIIYRHIVTNMSPREVLYSSKGDGHGGVKMGPGYVSCR